MSEPTGTDAADDAAEDGAPAGLLLDGALRPSESGRTHVVLDHRHQPRGVVALASRRDVRDAVAAARDGARRWAALVPTRRVALLLAVARALQDRAGPLSEEVAAAENLPLRRGADLVDLSLERWRYHAGWADKTAHLGAGSVTVSGDHVSATLVRPVGVVAVLAPQTSSLLGLVSVLAPVLATGSAAVVVASQDRPLPAVALARVLLDVGLPAGAVGLLTGRTAELAPWLASHRDVDAVDLVGAPPAQRPDLELAAAGAGSVVVPDRDGEPDWTRPADLARLRVLLTRTALGH